MREGSPSRDSIWIACGIVIGLFFGLPENKLFEGLAFGLSAGYLISHSISYKHYFIE